LALKSGAFELINNPSGASWADKKYDRNKRETSGRIFFMGAIYDS
jgi:hypothetical protein